MKILYNQSQLKRTLILGIAFLIIGVLSLMTTAKIYLAGLGGIGIAYIINYLYFKNRAYIILTENEIIQKTFFKKQIEIREIKSVKYFAGDYIVKTEKNEMIIDTNFIDKESIESLKAYFEKLMQAKQPAANTR